MKRKDNTKALAAMNSKLSAEVLALKEALKHETAKFVVLFKEGLAKDKTIEGLRTQLARKPVRKVVVSDPALTTLKSENNDLKKRVADLEKKLSAGLAPVNAELARALSVNEKLTSENERMRLLLTTIEKNNNTTKQAHEKTIKKLRANLARLQQQQRSHSHNNTIKLKG